MISPNAQMVPEPMESISESLPEQTRSIVQEMDRDPSMYLGNPQIAGAPSFMAAVRGIEDGDYQGLEHMDFGSVDGTPAVSFVDEDGQRQVIRMTMPQWTAALEQRSRARKELENAYRIDAIKKALKPQFDRITSEIEGISDPVVAGAWNQLYEMDPETAVTLAGKSFAKNEPTNVLYGREVPDGLFKAWTGIEDVNYKNKMRTLEQLEYSTNDTMTRSGIGMVRGMVRPPDALSLPAEMTPSDFLMARGSGPMPMVNVINQATVPMGIPGVPAPIVPPAPGPDGQYRPEEFSRWLNEFNTQVVMPMLGWAPYDINNPSHVGQIVDALNIYNNTRGAALPVPAVQPTVQPRPGSRAASEAAVAAPSTAANEMEQPSIPRDLEMNLTRYSRNAIDQAKALGMDVSDNPTETEILEAFIRIHQFNMQQREGGKEPIGNPPPQIVESVYNMIMEGAGE